MKRNGTELTATWTMERAKRAGVTSNPAWQKFPEQMLRWRAISECARVVAPDVIGGLYLHEEMGKPVDAQGQIIDAEFSIATEAPSVAPTGSPESSSSVEGEARPSSQSDSPAGASPSTPSVINGQQRRLLFATLRDSGKSVEDLHDFIVDSFGKQSTRELTWPELDKTLKWLKGPGREPGEEG